MYVLACTQNCHLNIKSTYCVGVAAAVRITWRMVNMMAKKAGPWPRPPRPRPARGLERPWAGLAELHKSALHVHTVASPSSMHFSEPCIQQARNRTTERKIDVINMQTSPAFVITTSPLPMFPLFFPCTVAVFGNFWPKIFQNERMIVCWFGLGFRRKDPLKEKLT